MSTDVFALNFTVETSISDVQSTMKEILAEQLMVNQIVAIMVLIHY